MLLLGYLKTCLWRVGVRCNRQKKKKKKGRPRCIVGRPGRPLGPEAVREDGGGLLTVCFALDQGKRCRCWLREAPEERWVSAHLAKGWRPRVGLEMLLRGQLWERKADDRLPARGRSHHCERICPHFSNVSLRKTHLREDGVAK